ncbi:hypothetical protein CBR_g4112 [Chara braunii]|uniref:ABC transporter domain-containing protein n=1 Tax=Chara braunii TaxID=69332 RepID=A0A388KHD4_CHABU|nr:hypothetical protein CBR_g4112 [Chara braunii]|eukprot:GBG69418.1 hypothetical protein CBR_g4112 [Chara braunii]
MAYSLLWYTIESACSALQLAVTEYLCLQWRRRLTQAAHEGYFQGQNILVLARQQRCRVSSFQLDITDNQHPTSAAPSKLAPLSDVFESSEARSKRTEKQSVAGNYACPDHPPRSNLLSSSSGFPHFDRMPPSGLALSAGLVQGLQGMVGQKEQIGFRAGTAGSYGDGDAVQVVVMKCDRVADVKASGEVPGMLVQRDVTDVDNPDQRMTDEIRSLCTSLGVFMTNTFTAPLTVVYYSYVVWRYVGWVGPVGVYAFFFLGSMVTRKIIAPIAALVARQEKLEGNFRIGHVRVRDAAESIVLSHALPTEHVHIDADLDNVLAVQEKLVFQHSILEFAMKVYDYFSTAVNYLILLVPIFAGAFAEATKDDAGKVAQLISNSSFATLQLMYGFSMLIDASKYASDVAGHASRVAELFEALGIIQEGMKNTESMAPANLSEAGPGKQLGTGSVIHPRHKKGVEKAAPADPCRLSSEVWTKSNQLADAPGGLTSSPSGGSKLQCTVEEGQRVRADHQKDLSTGTRQTGMEVRGRSIALQEEQTVDWTMVRAPTIFHLCGGDDWLEYSIHRVPRELYALLVAVFPGKWPEDMLVIPTFQCGGVDLCIPPVKRGKGEGAADDTDEVDEGFGKLCMRVGEDMDRMLGVFLRWQSSICGYLQSKGYWADSVDPSSGYALAPRGGWGNITSSTHQQGHAGSQQDPVVEKRIMEKPPQEHWESKLCYSEVYAARVLLGYEVQQVGACPVVVHPRFGTRAYPASLVTTAPLEPLLEAISAARDGFSGEMEAEPELVSAGDKSSAEGGKGVGQEHKKGNEEEEEGGDDKSWVKVAGHSEIMQESWDVNEKQKSCLVIPDNSMQIEDPPFAEQRLLDQCPILPLYNSSCGKNTTGLGREQVHDDALDEVEKELLMRVSAMTIKQSTAGENGKVEQGSTAALSVTTSHMMRQETAISGDRQTANDQDMLVIKEMTCSIPDSGRVIVKDLTVRLQQGESLLVMGPSGCGKTTIVKAIGGIWPLDAGSVKMVEWNKRETQAPNVIVLTQTPLMARGGLLAQLIYPLLPVDRGDLGAALSETTDFELRCQGKGPSRVATGQQEDDDRFCDEYQPFLLKEQVIQWNPSYGKDDGGGGGDGGGDTTTQLGGSRRPTVSSSFSGSRCWTREWAHGKRDRRRVPQTFQRGWTAIHEHPEWPAKLRKVLEMVDLGYLLQRVGGDWEAQIDWRNAVSLGEQQRLSIARVFFHMPQLVVLDEATSALGEEMEEKIYRHLMRLGISFVSISHRSRMEAWHTKTLRLDGIGLGTWNLHSRFTTENS